MDIERLERDLWEGADNLRANSKLTSSDYFMPVLGVIFLRHAANRFEAATRQIKEDQANGTMPKRKVLPADYVRMIPQWQGQGYDVKLVFLRLANPDLAVARVASRVAQGGHDVPEPVIRRRFAAGWGNFNELYRPLVDRWVLYDSSGEQPVLMDAGQNDDS